jgi:CheY-like chemotaxis protein
VVIITSMWQAEYRQAAIDAGCDDYLLLPVLPDELLSVVKRLAVGV